MGMTDVAAPATHPAGSPSSLVKLISTASTLLTLSHPLWSAASSAASALLSSNNTHRQDVLRNAGHQTWWTCRLATYVALSLSAPPVAANPSPAFNHDSSRDAEQEYDRLRDLARSEAAKRGQCYDRSRQAYDSGDGAAAKQLSNEAKEHGNKMAQYNKQASDFIFRENNAEGRVASDTIDLHGQFVEEAEDILEERIKYAKGTGQQYLHVIVGKGNHSPGHIQKIKPRVEQVCRDLGLQYRTEANEGRILVNLQGGPADAPPQQGGGYHGGYQQPHHGGQQQHQQPHHGGQQQHQQQQQQDEGVKILKWIFRKLRRLLCS